jgi:hypothetical protein
MEGVINSHVNVTTANPHSIHRWATGHMALIGLVTVKSIVDRGDYLLMLGSASASASPLKVM